MGIPWCVRMTFIALPWTEFPWHGRGVSVVLLRDFHGTSMGLPWDFAGTSEFPWGLRGAAVRRLCFFWTSSASLGSSWDFQGTSKFPRDSPTSIRLPRETSEIPSWCAPCDSDDNCMGIPWYLGGPCTTVVPMGLPWKFHGNSMGVSCGFFGTPMGLFVVRLWCSRGTSMGLPWAPWGPYTGVRI